MQIWSQANYLPRPYPGRREAFYPRLQGGNIFFDTRADEFNVIEIIRRTHELLQRASRAGLLNFDGTTVFKDCFIQEADESNDLFVR